ncbi:MAG: type II secretion system F family protein [Geminicoccaceae bacterium]|nr:type II secretion system F family protein [Geminicoccaceae bacterium]MDW8123565.1 type II secretion system F family protein [Geminicoccaceae bacterium]MDW8339906.1 type II secretion system F family protein [Geminicoccaceae bacterium]
MSALFAGPETFFAALVGAATFVAVLATWFALLDRDRTRARARLLQRRRQELQRAGGERRRRRPERGLAERLVAGLRLAKSGADERLRDRLARAGLRSPAAKSLYLLAKLAAPAIAGGLGLLLVYGLQLGGKSASARLLLLLGAVVAGFYAPDLYLSNRAAKRRVALARQLPDGLDLLVVCAEAGLSLDVALTRVAEEIGKSAPELAEEFGLTAVELNFMPDRRQALANLGRRVDLPAVRGVVNTLIQTEKYGTPLAQSLRVLASEFREERLLRAEEKAARLPAILTVPMIVFILPALFIVLVGPAILDVYDNLIKK